MENEFGFKELYDVTLKTTSSIEVKGRRLEAGETVAAFDEIQIASFQESKNNHSAHGGWDDRSYIYWSTTREVTIQFAAGIFSQVQLALLLNAKLVNVEDKPLLIKQRENLESDENGIIKLKHVATAPIFVYKKSDASKINYSIVDNQHLQIDNPFVDVLVDYLYEYNSPYQNLTIGSSLINGFLYLEGKTKVKDDITGHVRTALVRMPKLRLISGLSMRLGEKALPYVPTLSATALPEGGRSDTKAMELIFLSDDIDSDM